MATLTDILYKKLNEQNRTIIPLDTRKRIKERDYHNLYPKLASSGGLAREVRVAHTRAINRAKVLPTTSVRTNQFPRIVIN